MKQMKHTFKYYNKNWENKQPQQYIDKWGGYNHQTDTPAQRAQERDERISFGICHGNWQKFRGNLGFFFIFFFTLGWFPNRDLMGLTFTLDFYIMLWCLSFIVHFIVSFHLRFEEVTEYFFLRICTQSIWFVTKAYDLLIFKFYSWLRYHFKSYQPDCIFIPDNDISRKQKGTDEPPYPWKGGHFWQI